MPKVKTATHDSSHHVVTRLRVSAGFLAGAELEFVDGLNCLIGGRGAGKTTALEFLRFGLGLMPDARLHQQRHKAIDGLVKSNLGSGHITVELRTKAGTNYTAGRGVNQDVQVLDALGTPVPISLDDDLIFGADVFSQNEIEEIASNPAAQLELLDRFAPEQTAGIRRELSSLARQLEHTGVKLLRLDEELENLAARASELPGLEERLKGLAAAPGPDADRLNTAHAQQLARKREAQLVLLLKDAVDKFLADLSAALSAYRGSVETHLDPELRDGANAEILGPLHTQLLGVAAPIEQAMVSTRDRAAATAARIDADGASLAERHATQEAAYGALLTESAELGGRSAERSALQVAIAAAQTIAKEHKAKARERDVAVTARQVLLDRVSELRDRRFEIRKAVAARLTARFHSIRVTIGQSEDQSAYRAMVTDVLKGAGMRQGVVADRLCHLLLPSELARLMARNDAGTFSERTGLDKDRARKVLGAFRASGRMYELETVDIEDRPVIELLDGEQYKQSPHLSTGQRCTTILPILLLQSERPLLIDQPEDNLDNAFIYETVVAALQAVKSTRQVIFVTHNPNIPVLGSAERVFVFASDGQSARVTRCGSVDDCKDHIERILEGGRDAFLKRKERYGY